MRDNERHHPEAGTTQEVQAVIRSALDRHRMGQSKYGVFDPRTDSRDLFREIEEELLDSINYLVFQILKIRAVRDRGKDIKGIINGVKGESKERRT